MDALNRFNEAFGNIAKIYINFGTLYENLYQNKFTRSALLIDKSELDLLEKKLEAYERAIENGTCRKGGAVQGAAQGIVLIKEPTIAVKNNKNKNQTNLLAFLKNIFEPKLIELNYEK
jgi:hypothetical protein